MFMKFTVLMFAGLLSIAPSAKAQSYHIMPGAHFLKCSANAKVAAITDIYLTQTTKLDQLCGGYTVQPTPEKPAVFNPKCILGKMDGSDLILDQSEAYNGTYRLIVRKTEGAYKLLFTFECDWNHEETCMPGIEVIKSEDQLKCIHGVLRY